MAKKLFWITVSAMTIAYFYLGVTYGHQANSGTAYMRYLSDNGMGPEDFQSLTEEKKDQIRIAITIEGMVYTGATLVGLYVFAAIAIFIAVVNLGAVYGLALILGASMLSGALLSLLQLNLGKGFFEYSGVWFLTSMIQAILLLVLFGISRGLRRFLRGRTNARTRPLP